MLQRPDRDDVEQRPCTGSRFVRAVLADDRWLLPECRVRLEREPQVSIVEETGRLADVASIVRSVRPRVVVIATALADPEAIDVIRATRDVAPVTEVVLVSTRTDEGWVRLSLQAGARAYAVHDDPDIGRAVRAVAAGGAYFSPVVATLLRVGYLRGAGLPIDGLLACLTDADQSVLRALLDGLTSSEIAARLGVSATAVDACRARIVTILAARDGLGVATTAARVERSR
jgi:DNA-binding NarL/FixJ family response regulator